LYKTQILWTGKDYPGGLDVVRTKAKQQFFENRFVEDPTKLQAAFAKGEYILKELEALNKFHKYRTLKKRYDEEES